MDLLRASIVGIPPERLTAATEAPTLWRNSPPLDEATKKLVQNNIQSKGGISVFMWASVKCNYFHVFSLLLW